MKMLIVHRFYDTMDRIEGFEVLRLLEASEGVWKLYSFRAY